MVTIDLNTVVADAEHTREKELRAGLGGPLADLKKFLEGDGATHHEKMMVVQAFEAIMRDPASIPTLATDSNGRKAAALGGGTSATTDTPEVAQLIALARQYPDRAGFLSTVLKKLTQLDPAVADTTVRLTSKVAERVGDWAAVPHPTTGKPTIQPLIDNELRIAELERQLAAANQAIADIAAKAATPLHNARDMAGRLSRGVAHDIDPADAGALYQQLDDLQRTVQNATPARTTTGRATPPSGRRGGARP